MNIINEALEVLKGEVDHKCDIYAITKESGTNFYIEIKDVHCWSGGVIGLSFKNVFLCIANLLDQYKNDRRNVNVTTKS